MVIVKKNSWTTCWLTVGRQIANRLPNMTERNKIVILSKYSGIDNKTIP